MQVFVVWLIEWIWAKCESVIKTSLKWARKLSEIHGLNKKNKEALENAKTPEEQKDATEDLASRL